MTAGVPLTILELDGTIRLWALVHRLHLFKNNFIIPLIDLLKKKKENEMRFKKLIKLYFSLDFPTLLRGKGT